MTIAKIRLHCILNADTGSESRDFDRGGEGEGVSSMSATMLADEENFSFGMV